MSWRKNYSTHSKKAPCLQSTYCFSPFTNTHGCNSDHFSWSCNLSITPSSLTNKPLKTSKTQQEITHDNSHWEKTLFYRQQVTPQCNKRWFIISPAFLHKKYYSSTQKPIFHKLSKVKVFPIYAVRMKKVILEENSLNKTVFQEKEKLLDNPEKAM